MLVAGKGPPDKRVGAPTSSKVIQVILTTGNVELNLTEALQLIYTAFLNSLKFFWVIYEYH